MSALGGPSVDGDVAVQVTSRGDVSQQARDLAVERLSRVARSAPRTVRRITVTLSHEPDPARERPCIAKGSIDVDGRVVRAHVAAREMIQAVELLEEHMSRRLRDLADRDEATRSLPPTSSPGEWRHGELPAHRPEYFPRPAHDRRLVRRKTYALGPETIEEAAWEMRLLDHDFFLFTNSRSGEENVVYLGEEGVLHLRLPASAGEAFVDPVVIDPEPAPILSTREAIEMFDLADGRFLFFLERDSGRGQVLYRRFDGDYGLIVPSDEAQVAGET